ncbi:MAG: hypothetical protein ACOC3V_04615 [bacterium]
MRYITEDEGHICLNCYIKYFDTYINIFIVDINEICCICGEKKANVLFCQNTLDLKEKLIDFENNSNI